MPRGCAKCGTDCPDNLRGLTVHVDNTAGDTELCADVELCDGACVYDYELAAHWTTEDPDAPPPPSILATWHLSDSEIVLYSLGCASADLRAVLPGNCLPAFSRICAAPGVELALVITYGDCSARCTA